MDPRIEALSQWQREVYQLCWTAGACQGEEAKKAGEELEQRKKDRLWEYEGAVEVWEEIMLEVMY